VYKRNTVHIVKDCTDGVRDIVVVAIQRRNYVWIARKRNNYIGIQSTEIILFRYILIIIFKNNYF
jgi:hypothetical protein